MRRKDLGLLFLLVAISTGVGWLAFRRGQGGFTVGDGPETVAGEGEAPTEATTTEGGPEGLVGGGRGKPKPREPDPVPTVPNFPRSDGVFGRISDAKDVAVPGAKVTLVRLDPTTWNWWSSDGEAVATADAAADGTYLVGPVGAGAYKWRIRCEATGYARAGADVAAKGARVDLHLDRGGSIRVRVKDEAGAPIPQASVRVGDDAALTRAAATTDASGEARLDGLPLGGVDVTVECLEYASTTSGGIVVTEGATAEKTIVLRRAIRVTGKVLDEVSGAPIAGAIVTATTGAGGASAPTATASTDGEGRFQLMAPGRAGMNLEVTARKEGLGSSSTSVQLQATPAGPGPGAASGTDVLLRLGKRSGLSGSVIDADQRPVPGASVVFGGSIGQRGLGEASARTDAEGRFTIDVPPGTNREGGLMLAAYAPEKGLGTLSFIPAKNPAPVIRLLGAGSIVATVKGPDGQPAEGAVIAFWLDQGKRADLPAASAEFQPWLYEQASYDPRLVNMSAATDAGGRLSIPGAPVGTYWAWVTWRDIQMKAPGQASVRPGGSASLEITIKSGAVIEGRVRDTEGKPVAGANVSGWDPQNQSGEQHSSTARSDADGHFTLRGVLGENWVVSASATGYLEAPQQPAHPGDKSVEIRLTPLGWIDGVVIGPDGKPFTGPFDANASQDAEANGNKNDQAGNTDSSGSFASADGAFRLRGLSAGDYVVSVTTGEGFVPTAPARATVVNGAGAGPIEVRLVRGASITGVVVDDASRRPLSGVGVSLRITGPAESGGQTGAWSQTDASGRFALVGLAAGPYLISATDGSGGTVEEAVVVGVGQALERELATRRPGAIAVRVVDVDGRAVAKARVMLQKEGGAYINPNWEALRKEGRIDFSRGGWEAAMSTNADGALTRWHVPPGRVNVIVRSRTTPFKHEPVTVDAASDRTTEITITVTWETPGGR